MLKKVSFLLVISTIAFALITNDVKAAGGEDQPLTSGGPVSLNNPLTGQQGDVPGGIPGLIGRVINGVLGIVGSLALLMFIYGGLLWMTSAGNDEKVKQGKDVLIWATLGLLIIFASYALVNFIIFKGIGAVGGGNNGSVDTQTEEMRRNWGGAGN